MYCIDFFYMKVLMITQKFFLDNQQTQCSNSIKNTNNLWSEVCIMGFNVKKFKGNWQSQC